MNARDEIRAAMERLLAGNPRHTDGRLTKINLALEAGIGRATLYRQHDLLAEWNRRTAESEITDNPQSASISIARLTRQLDEERRLRREADRTAEGLAFVVAELYRCLDADTPQGTPTRLPRIRPS
jgi:hypothetical protein